MHKQGAKVITCIHMYNTDMKILYLNYVIKLNTDM